MGFCIGSIQILLNFEIFRLSWNISLSNKGLKSPFYSQQAIWALKCIRERFNDSLKISKFTRICMENHSSMTGWQKSFPRVVVLSLFSILNDFESLFNRCIDQDSVNKLCFTDHDSLARFLKNRQLCYLFC